MRKLRSELDIISPDFGTAASHQNLPKEFIYTFDADFTTKDEKKK